MENKLNLGCGTATEEGFVNIDKREDVGADMVVDIELSGLSSFDSDSIDVVVAKDFLEHIRPIYVIQTIEEIWRVLRHGGMFESFTPSSDGRGAFQDPTHRSFWNLNSWQYYTNDDMRKQIDTKAKFEVVMLTDKVSSDAGHVIHTHAVLHAIKGGAQ